MCHESRKFQNELVVAREQKFVQVLFTVHANQLTLPVVCLLRFAAFLLQLASIESSECKCLGRFDAMFPVVIWNVWHPKGKTAQSSGIWNGMSCGSALTPLDHQQCFGSIEEIMTSLGNYEP